MAKLDPVTATAARGAFRVTCEARPAGVVKKDERLWLRFTAGPVRYHVGRVRVPRLAFRLAARLAAWLLA